MLDWHSCHICHLLEIKLSLLLLYYYNENDFKLNKNNVSNVLIKIMFLAFIKSKQISAVSQNLYPISWIYGTSFQKIKHSSRNFLRIKVTPDLHLTYCNK